MEMSNGVACPKCHTNDQSQKVSAIVMAGTSSYQASGPAIGTAFVGGKMGLATGFTSVSGTNQTALAAQLMPPVKPKKPKPYQADPVGALLAVVIACIGFLLMTASRGVDIGVIIAVAVAVEILLVWSSYGKVNALYTKQVLPPWQKVLARWNRLYYCYRDDIVYDPETGRAVPPSQINTLLYD